MLFVSYYLCNLMGSFLFFLLQKIQRQESPTHILGVEGYVKILRICIII